LDLLRQGNLDFSLPPLRQRRTGRGLATIGSPSLPKRHNRRPSWSKRAAKAKEKFEGFICSFRCFATVPEPQREVHIKDGPDASIPERHGEDQLRKTSQSIFRRC